MLQLAQMFLAASVMDGALRGALIGGAAGAVAGIVIWLVKKGRGQ